MSEKKEHYLKKTVKILDWVIRIYVIVAIALLIYDFYAHPEMYNVVSERPVRQSASNNISLPETYNSNVIIPDYVYESSTIEECKPLKSLYDFYHRWLRPLLLLIVINSILALISKIDFSKVIIHEESDTEEEDIQAKQKENMQ